MYNPANQYNCAECQENEAKDGAAHAAAIL